MSFPAPTSGLGVAARINVSGNGKFAPSVIPGKNDVVLSLSGLNGPTTFQLNPQLVDAANNPVTLGTVYTLSAVAGSTPGTLTLSAVAINGVYTGTITGGGSNALAGYSFTVAGFVNSVNNGTFICTASTTTTLTLEQSNGDPINTVAETHAATAQALEGTAVYTGTFTGVGTALTLSAAAVNGVYTGTITGGANNALVGNVYIVTGFTNAANNGTFVATASTTTVLTLKNAASVAETHAGTATQSLVGISVTIAGFTAANNNGSFLVTASSSTTITVQNPKAAAVTAAGTATSQETVNDFTYVVYGVKTLTGNTYQPSGTSTPIATISNTGLLTAVAVGHTQAEVSFPFANNTIGSTGAVAPNPMAGLPHDKIYAEINVAVRV